MVAVNLLSVKFLYNKCDPLAFELNVLYVQCYNAVNGLDTIDTKELSPFSCHVLL